MLVRADIDSNKTEFLIRKYEELLEKGISVDKILFLVPNAFRKKYVVDCLSKCKKDFVAVNTFQGLIYHSVAENWEFLSSKIKTGEEKEKPNLCSMELSQYIMKRCIDEVGFKDYFSKINLLHQLFRRYYLILQNDLNDKEVFERSKILGETWGEEAQKVLKKFEEKTLKTRCFDYLRQMPLFKYLYENTDYFKDIEYFLLDDGDEITQFELNFIKHLKPQLKENYICYDPNGASRAGYLSAKKDIEKDFIKIFNEKPQTFETVDITSKRAENFYKNMTEEKKVSLDNFEIKNFVTRHQMIKTLCERVKSLLKSGVKKNEISIIAPEIDFSLENFIKKYLPENSYEFLSGNKKLVQDEAVKNIFTILKLANPSWELKIEQYEINSLLNNFSKIPLKYCQKVFTEFKKSGQLKFFEFENKKYETDYKNLLKIIKDIEILPLSKAIKTIQYGKGENSKINFLIKQAEEFEYLFEKNILNKNLQKNIIKQFENSMIAENSADNTVNFEKIIISTPQKFIDIQHKVKYQFWLDLSAKGWLVEDIGNIYNAWGFQAEWDKKKIEFEELLNLTKDKTGRILRKLALLTTEKIYGYSSCYDSLGFENLYGISEFLSNPETTVHPLPKTITPRPDQKPALDYKKGKMGIAAVPGAGKTTILLALIIKMLNEKIPPENIFVLTYMDSAAKHFKEKLLEFMPDLKTMPNISTIHGLCLRILKDNSNYVKANLDADFQVCDELNKKTFIFEALFKSNLKEDDFSKYEKALSYAKLNPDVDLNSQDKSLYQFKKFFDNYNKILYENSMIDYDDMLFYAVKILEENPEILKNYQTLCEYIIEDEAQDSSLIQQKLLSLLSQKNGNLIRCGDPNQAITTTFTSADTKGFNTFIEKNKNVKMNTSQRCAKPIYSLANNLMLKYPDSFFKNIIQGTKDNPKSEKAVITNVFETDFEEKNFILNSIQNIFRNDENASIAILLRNNYQVENYSGFLNDNEIKTFQKTDNLKNSRCFNVILIFLEMLEYPYNNKILSDGLIKLCENNIYKIKDVDIEKIKSLKEPFLTQNPDDFNSVELSRFWWDFDYIFSNSNQEPDFLTCLIADYYFKDETELENSYMTAQLIKSMSKNTKNEQTVIEKLKSVKNLSNLGLVRFIKDEKINENKKTVQIMTIHKSKGDEFDYVFIPEMSSKQFTLNINDIKISSENYFCECLKPKDKRKAMEKLKQDQIDETLHLIYVGITRAKKQLNLSFCKNIKRGAKKLSPCEILDKIGCNEIKNPD